MVGCPCPDGRKPLSNRDHTEHAEHADPTDHLSTGNRAVPTDRTPSEAQWLRVNDYLRGNRYRLAVDAARGYPDAPRLAGSTLLSAPAGRLPEPIPLSS